MGERVVTPATMLITVLSTLAGPTPDAQPEAVRFPSMAVCQHAQPLVVLDARRRGWVARVVCEERK